MCLIWLSPCITGTLEAGHSIDELLSHGIDLMSYILPSRSSVTELKCVLLYCGVELLTYCSVVNI